MRANLAKCHVSIFSTLALAVFPVQIRFHNLVLFNRIPFDSWRCFLARGVRNPTANCCIQSETEKGEIVPCILQITFSLLDNVTFERLRVV